MTSINKITFQEDGSPYSEQFDDIYFDTESGYQQSEHVFVKGNNIPARLVEHQGELTIGETGFGTGLNFLLTLKHYLALANQHQLATLHFISTEKYPLTKAQLKKSLECFSELQQEIDLLVHHYPDSPENIISCSMLDNKVKLTIYLDDATHAFSQIRLPRKANGLIDAWYLDGFSPAKNPQMWTTALFEQVARLSKPQATLSTFTVAGFIRRGLHAVGFRIDKQAYQGKKKEILTAIYQQNKQNGKGYQLRADINKPQHVSIIGGGIASACAAYALTKKGIKVTLYCKDEQPAQGASSNAIGALFPLLHQQVDDISRFYQQAFWHAVNWYKSLTQQGYHYSHNWCGLLEIAYKKALQERQAVFADNAPWPETLIHSVDAQQASELAKIKLPYGGLFMPSAGWIAPAELVQQLLQAAKDSTLLKVKTSVEIHNMVQLDDERWLLKSNKGDIKASVVVFCGGAEAIGMPYINQLPLTSVRGQVTSLATNKAMEKLNTVICHKGYLTPENNGIHCIGATFEKNSQNIEACEADDQYNLHMLEKCLPQLNVWQTTDIVSSKARLRCMTPDHLPMVGSMPNIEQHIESYGHLAKDKNWRCFAPTPNVNNLYLLTGLGARGLCTAPLLADILAADLSGTPYPVDSEMLFNLAPNRFIIRDLIKRKI